MKKPFYKKWWFWVIVVIIVVAAAGGSGGDKQEEAKATSADPKQETQQEQPKKEEAKKEEPKKEEKKKITLADYEAIQAGDSLTGEGGATYEDVVAKFGEPSTKSESQSGDLKMTMAVWTKNVNGDLGANFNITFIEKDGVKRVSGKGQTGMK